MQIVAKVKALRSRQGEREKLKTAYGIWFVTHYKNIYYAVCTDETYPERHAFGMIEKLKAEADGKEEDPKF